MENHLWESKTEAQKIAQLWTRSEVEDKVVYHDYRSEQFWDEHEQWLTSRGYSIQRRPKKPRLIWGKGNSTWDFLASKAQEWVEALRIDDNEPVYLKMTHPETNSEESAINEFIYRPVGSPEPFNHCLKPLEILESPSTPLIKILVLPVYPLFDPSTLKSMADAVDFFRQLIEGIIFLHQLHIAYGGCRLDNIVVQTTKSYDDNIQRALRLTSTSTKTLKAPFATRTSRRYYFIDFSLSRGYTPNQASKIDIPDEEIQPVEEGDDPFSTDVYDLGLLIRELVDSSEGLDFMRPLMTDMTQKHPSGRPTVEDVMFRFEAGNRSLDPVELQSPIISRNSSFLNKLLRNMSHRFRSSTPDLIEPISIDPWSGSISDDSSPSSSSQASGARFVAVTIKGNGGTPQLPNLKKLRRRGPVPDFSPEHIPDDTGSVLRVKVPPTRRKRPPRIYIVENVPLQPDCVLHLNMEPYDKWNCRLCGCNISNKKEFVRHTRSKHPNAPICGCGKVFTTFEELQSHQIEYAHSY